MTGAAREKKTKYEEVYTTVEFARLFGCSLRTVQNYCEWGPENGGIDSYRVGTRDGIRIPKAELNRFRQKRRTADINHAASACAPGGV